MARHRAAPAPRRSTDFYALAVSLSKGSAADETKAAFERAGDLATRAEFPAERFSALLVRRIGVCNAGKSARRGVYRRSAFFERAEADGRSSAFGDAHRALGFWRFYFSATLAKARSEFELALNSFDMESDSEASEKFLPRHRGGLLGLPSTSVMVCRRPSPRASINQGGNLALAASCPLRPPPTRSVKIYIEGHRK